MEIAFKQVYFMHLKTNSVKYYGAEAIVLKSDFEIN